MDMTNYEPIACGIHDQLESLATLRSVCRVTAETEGSEVVLIGRIEDVFAREGAEFIRFATEDGEVREIRLDRIRSVETR